MPSMGPFAVEADAAKGPYTPSISTLERQRQANL